MDIAIIGAGLAGVTLARQLLRDQAGRAEIVVFEKSRGLGGRLANRRRDGFAFDHGAQYFTARSPGFRAVIEDAGTSIGIWPDSMGTLPVDVYEAVRRQTEARYVGMPAMNAPVTWLAEGLDIRRETQVAATRKAGTQWQVEGSDGSTLGVFDWVVSSAPAPQTAKLLPATFAHHGILQSVAMSGCFTLMLGCETAPDLRLQAAKIDHPVLGWIAVNSSKPGRPAPFSLVVHSCNDWADQHLDDDRDRVRQRMLDALIEVTGQDFGTADWIDLHRWRYANVERAAGVSYLLDTNNRLAACGDWCLGNRVECAFESGSALADALSAVVRDQA